MVTWEPAGFKRSVFEGTMIRRRIPSIEAIITVSTRLGWHQRTLDELFSPELDDRLLKIGLSERARVGSRHRIVITATARHSDSVQTLVWEPGHMYPELAEHRHVEPPYAVPTGFDEDGEPTGFEGDDDHRPVSSPLSPVDAYARRVSPASESDPA